MKSPGVVPTSTYSSSRVGASQAYQLGVVDGDERRLLVPDPVGQARRGRRARCRRRTRSRPARNIWCRIGFVRWVSTSGCGPPTDINGRVGGDGGEHRGHLGPLLGRRTCSRVSKELTSPATQADDAPGRPGSASPTRAGHPCLHLRGDGAHTQGGGGQQHHAIGPAVEHEEAPEHPADGGDADRDHGPGRRASRRRKASRARIAAKTMIATSPARITTSDDAEPLEEQVRRARRSRRAVRAGGVAQVDQDEAVQELRQRAGQGEVRP